MGHAYFYSSFGLGHDPEGVDVGIDGSLLEVVELEEGAEGLTVRIVDVPVVLAGFFVEDVVRRAASSNPEFVGFDAADGGGLHWLVVCGCAVWK